MRRVCKQSLDGSWDLLVCHPSAQAFQERLDFLPARERQLCQRALTCLPIASGRFSAKREHHPTPPLSEHHCAHGAHLALRRLGCSPVGGHCLQHLVQEHQHRRPGEGNAWGDMQCQGAQGRLMQRAGNGPAEHSTDDGEDHDVGWRGQGLPICRAFPDGCNAL